MMGSKQPEPVYRKDDRELLGYLLESGGMWSALTTFGYEFGIDVSKDEARQRVERDGLALVHGMWQYFDADDGEWHPCRIKRSQFNRVTVMRTSPLGYEDYDHAGFITIDRPDSSKLVSLL